MFENGPHPSGIGTWSLFDPPRWKADRVKEDVNDGKSCSDSDGALKAKMNMLLKKREAKKKEYKSELFEIEVELKKIEKALSALKADAEK